MPGFTTEVSLIERSHDYRTALRPVGSRQQIVPQMSRSGPVVIPGADAFDVLLS
jgi:hypothetical protein